jgi:hypothetical protein
MAGQTDPTRGVMHALPRYVAPPAMMDVAQRVADCKMAIDDLVRHKDPLVGFLEEPFSRLGGTCAASYAAAVIPFLDWLHLTQDSCSPKHFALIDSRVVVGWSWRWSPRDSEHPDGRRDNEALLAKCEAWAAEFAAGVESCRANVASCIWLPALGIAWAEEGKNRVALYRRSGVAYFPALVQVDEYPAAARMTRYRVEGRELVVLDQQWVRALAGGQLTADLLDAYGVEIAHSWPSELPPLADVLAVLNPPKAYPPRDLSGQAPLHVGTNLDLHVLASLIDRRQREAARQDEVVKACILDVPGLRLSHAVVLWAALLFLVSIMLAALPATEAHWFLLPAGVCLGMLTLPWCRVWRVPRARLRA